MLNNVGNRAEAAECYVRVLRDRQAEPHLLLGAATEYATALMWDLGRPDEAVVVAAELTAGAAGGPFADAAIIHEAAMTTYAGRPAAALRLVALVDGELDDGLRRMLALVRTTASALAQPGRRDDDDIAVLTAPSELPGDHSFGPAVGLIAVELAHELAGRYADAAAVVAEARGNARFATTPLSNGWLALAGARAELAVGRVQHALLAALDAADCFAEVNHPSGRRWALGAALLARALGGDRDGCAELNDELDVLAPGAPFLDADLLRARAWGAWAVGDSRHASVLFETAAQRAVDAATPALEAVVLHDAHRTIGAPVAKRLDTLARQVDAPSIEMRARHLRLLARRGADDLLRLAHDLEACGALLHRVRGGPRCGTRRRSRRAPIARPLGHRAASPAVRGV